MKFLKSEDAESEIVGHVIILGITVLGISMIALYGIPVISSLQDTANVRTVEQAFTVLDSRASRAVLGESILQTININLGGGSLTVEPNSTNAKSYMVLKSQNNTFSVTIPMGKVKYQLDDRIVAYEGGGVWSKYPSGSVMLSPPEFHYNGVTLTLPVFNISGSTSVGGKGSAEVSFEKKATTVQYPNTSCDGCSNRTNAVNGTKAGKVYLNITSDFYDAWAEYARSLLYTTVTENSTTNTVSIELTIVPSTIGGTTAIPDPIDIRGLDPTDDTPLENFSFRIYNSDISKLNWDIRTQSGNKRLIFHIQYKKVSGEDYAAINVGYQVGSGSGSAETWKGTDNSADNLFPVQGIAPNQYVDVDLLNRSITLPYEQVSDVGTTSGCSVAKIDGSGTKFNSTGFSWAGETLSTKPLYNITQHYIQLMAQEGDIPFSQCSPSDDNHSPSASSTLLLGYNAAGALTFLHVSDNEVDAKIS